MYTYMNVSSKLSVGTHAYVHAMS